MAGVPYIFGNATTSIPLTNLDANFNTGVTIGNTTVGLGNTVTTLGNVILTNATISSPSGIAANAVIYSTSTGNLTGNASIFTVDSNNNVGIGTTTPAVVGSSRKELTVKSTVADTYSILNLIGIRDVGGNQNGDVNFINSFGSQTITSRISGINGASSNTEGNLVFQTKTSAGALTEAMRIDSSGNFMVATTGALGKATVAGTGYYGNGINGNSTGATGGAYFYQAAWDTAQTTHTIAYGSSTGYTQYDNAAGFLIVSVSNKANSGKAGSILIAWAKARSDGIYITTVSTQKSTSLTTLTASTSGNNIIVTTDSDCYMTFNVLGGV